MALQTLSALVRTWRAHPVTSGKLPESIIRFMKWQFAARLHNGPLVFPFVGPTRLMAARGQTAVTGNLYFGLSEFPEMAFLLHFLRPQDVFVDVGANVGIFSVLASGAAGAHTVAFEPIDATILKMNDMLRLNDIVGRVDIRQCALGAETGKVKFFDAGDTVNRVISADEKVSSYREVPQSTLDLELQGLAPAAIKLDVEGYELQVLKGASQVLSSPSLKVILLEVLEGASTSGSAAEIERLLREAGFAPYSYDAASRRLEPIRFDAAHQHRLSDNVLMIRDVESIRERVASAAPFEVLGRSF